MQMAAMFYTGVIRHTPSAGTKPTDRMPSCPEGSTLKQRSAAGQLVGVVEPERTHYLRGTNRQTIFVPRDDEPREFSCAWSNKNKGPLRVSKLGRPDNQATLDPRIESLLLARKKPALHAHETSYYSASRGTGVSLL